MKNVIGINENETIYNEIIKENNYIEQTKETCLKCGKECIKKDLKYSKLCNVNFLDNKHFMICDTCC